MAIKTKYEQVIQETREKHEARIAQFNAIISRQNDFIKGIRQGVKNKVAKTLNYLNVSALQFKRTLDACDEAFQEDQVEHPPQKQEKEKVSKIFQLITCVENSMVQEPFQQKSDCIDLKDTTDPTFLDD